MRLNTTNMKPGIGILLIVLVLFLGIIFLFKLGMITVIIYVLNILIIFTPIIFTKTAKEVAVLGVILLIFNILNDIGDARSIRKLREDQRSSNKLIQYSHVAKLDIDGCSNPGGQNTCLGGDKLTEIMVGTYSRKGNESGPICSDEAIQKFQTAIQYEPNFPFAYYGLAICFAKKKNTDWIEYANKAKEIFDETIKVPGHNQWHDSARENLIKIIVQSKGKVIK